MSKRKKKASISYREAWERKRAEYWFSVAKFLLSIIGGIVGATIVLLITRLKI